MRRYLVFSVGLISLAVFVELGMVTRSGPLPIDTTVAFWFKTHRTSREIQFAQIASALSAPIIVFITTVLMLLFFNYWYSSWYRRDYIPLALVVAAILTSTLAKSFFHRSQPGAGIATLLDFEPSYPSSHMVMIAATGCSLLFVIGRRQFIIAVGTALVALLIGLVRLTLGVHWLTDIIGSVLLSFGLLMIFYALDDHLAQEEIRDL